MLNNWFKHKISIVLNVFFNEYLHMSEFFCTFAVDFEETMRRTCFHIAYWLLFIGLCIPAYAQEYLLNAIPAQEQLPVASIHVPFQDSEGYMWLGTRDGGLCRNDGYEVAVFGANYHVNSISEDQFGRIVFGTHDGLFALDKKDYSMHVVDSALLGWDVDPVLMASDGTLWVGTGKTVRHYDIQWRLIASYASEWKGQSVAPSALERPLIQRQIYTLRHIRVLMAIVPSSFS